MQIKSKDKVTNPLWMSSFHRCMGWLTFEALALVLIVYYTTLPNWLLIVIQVLIWIEIVGGIILCFGYIAAIAEKNVTVIEIRTTDDKKEK